MRLVYLMPGAGGTFYCENCMRDAGLIRALTDMGHQPLMVPLYLPLQIDDRGGLRESPIFFGGINVYLQQKSALFRKTPRWVDRLLDSPRLLRWAASKAGMTQARDLAATMLSMLQGEDGRQAKELDRLVAWLATEEKPDVVCISNALLLGSARRIRRDLGAAVACALQDEDIFVDSLPDPERQQVWDAIAERAADVDAFLAVSRYYADFMAERLRIPPEKMHVVHNGVPTANYATAPAPPDAPTLGFLERIFPDKGADIVLDAFLLLRERHDRLRLRFAGGWTSGDKPFIDGLRRRAADHGAAGAVDVLPNIGGEEKLAFIRSLSVLSVPARHGEAFGMYVLEALASGVPVVLPRHGAFPELIEATGGGVLYEPNEPEALAAALEPLLAEPQQARELGLRGREAVLERFDIAHAARNAAGVYESILAAPSQGETTDG